MDGKPRRSVKTSDKDAYSGNRLSERTAKQVSIHGTRPAGIYTAGTAQHFTNLQGVMPAKRCVILGSGDIGLIMARRLKLEGADVLGVYEVKPEPSGLTRNIIQCLEDFQIPLHLSKTVTRVFGEERLEGVEICKVDEQMQPIAGTEKRIDCDTLILSVGLIPENEIAENLQVHIDPKTKGPLCDSSAMTSVPGIYSCGNAFHVNDLVDYVSESGEPPAGLQRSTLRIKSWESFKFRQRQTEKLLMWYHSVVRQADLQKKVTSYFRCKQTLGKSELIVKSGSKVIYKKNFLAVRPPEMERIVIDFAKTEEIREPIVFELREVEE